jgi:hypothetical protein
MANTTRNQTSIDGSLYELCARGVKDKYFIKDDKDAIHPFQWTYKRWPGSLPEVRWTNPLNEPKFGQRCEFEFDLPGDVLLDAALVIDLPSWLPPEMSEKNITSNTYVAGTPDVRYGYVNGIGYFLFQQIEIYQDNLLLQSISGDSLYALQLTKGNWNQGFLTQAIAGIHDGSSISIMKNATPGRIEIKIPMIGCSSPGDAGLPICGIRNQTFRLRLTLRPLEKLVESTDDAEINPAPWSKIFTQDQSPLSPEIVLPAVQRGQIGNPIIQLRTNQLYLLNEARASLSSKEIEVPYIRYFDNIFNINQLDYTPIERGGTSIITKRLDANYSVERIVTYFRNTLEVSKNRLWNFSNSLVGTDGQFYSELKLVIAGQDREGPWEPDVWEYTLPDAKEDRSSSKTIATMDWGRGWRIEDEPPSLREPTGGINFSTADRPQLNITLLDIEKNPELDPPIGYKQVQMISVCESWALYRVRNGRGGLEYAN